MFSRILLASNSVNEFAFLRVSCKFSIRDTVNGIQDTGRAAAGSHRYCNHVQIEIFWVYKAVMNRIILSLGIIAFLTTPALASSDLLANEKIETQLAREMSRPLSTDEVQRVHQAEHYLDELLSAAQIVHVDDSTTGVLSDLAKSALICIDLRGALGISGSYGICSTTSRDSYLLKSWGVGVGLGAGLRAFALLPVSFPEAKRDKFGSLAGEYFGSNAIAPINRSLAKIFQSILRSPALTLVLGYFDNRMSGGEWRYLQMWGVGLGPLFDFSQTSIQLLPLGKLGEGTSL
jgi:hypothetical protein